MSLDAVLVSVILVPDEAAEAKIVAALGRISELEARLKQSAGQTDRLVPLGYDRHWNRFWVLGSLLPGSSGMCMWPFHFAGRLFACIFALILPVSVW